jgi:hypothetical protein
MHVLNYHSNPCDSHIMSENKRNKKAQRKQTKAKNILLRDAGLRCSDEPTKVRMWFSSFFAVALWPNAGHGLIHEVSRSHTTTRHSRYDSSGRVISSSQRPLPNNTQHSQQTNINASGRIRAHDLSRRAAADLHLRPRSHWDRQTPNIRHLNARIN